MYAYNALPAAPALYFVGAVALFFSFGLQKYALVKIYKVPPALNEELASRTRLCLIFLYGLHLISAPLFVVRQAVVVGIGDVGIADEHLWLWPFTLSWVLFAVWLLFDQLVHKTLDERQEDREAEEGVREEFTFTQHLKGINQHAPIDEYCFPRDMLLRTKRCLRDTWQDDVGDDGRE